MSRARSGASLQIAGVVTFVVAWAVLGALRDGYDPVTDAISRLAELGAPHRYLMTGGIVAFGAGALAFAPVLGGGGGIALAVAGLGSLGVAAFPCTAGCPGTEAPTDIGHSVAAGVHYVAFVAAPVLTARRPAFVVASLAAGVALALHASGLGPNGLLQRVGLTILDAWVVVVALRHLRYGTSGGAASSSA